MDLCTPVFGYVAILRSDEALGLDYGQFRQRVLETLSQIEDDAERNRIESEDAREAVYALSLLIDEQVAESEWIGREQWAAEPLNVVKINDPAGGVNFFEHLLELGERQKEVKKIFLICLAMGFHGKYAELDEVQQASQLAELRRKVVRSINRTSLEKREYLPWVFNEHDLDTQQAVRDAIDPHHRSNPCKIFPAGRSCVEAGHRGPAFTEYTRRVLGQEPPP